jgi:hypothetical protein
MALASVSVGVWHCVAEQFENAARRSAKLPARPIPRPVGGHFMIHLGLGIYGHGVCLHLLQADFGKAKELLDMGGTVRVHLAKGEFAFFPAGYLVLPVSLVSSSAIVCPCLTKVSLAPLVGDERSIVVNSMSTHMDANKKAAPWSKISAEWAAFLADAATATVAVADEKSAAESKEPLEQIVREETEEEPEEDEPDKAEEEGADADGADK